MSKNFYKKKKSKKKIVKMKIRLSQIFSRFILSRNNKCSVHYENRQVFATGSLSVHITYPSKVTIWPCTLDSHRFIAIH